MPKMRRAFHYLTAVALAVVLAACGGGKSPTAPSAAPPAPAPRVIAEEGGLRLPVDVVGGVYFNTTATGTIEAIVDYTFADTSLYVWIFQGRCTPELFEAMQCTALVSSFSGAKPRRVNAGSQPAGTYTLAVGNAGPRDELVSYQVIFTAAASAAGDATVSGGAGPADEPGFSAALPAIYRRE